MSVLFVLGYAASQLLPTSVASTVMAVSPPAMTLIAWALVSERPGIAHLAGAAIGLGGVCLMLLTGAGGVSVPGVLALAAAMLVSSFAHILTKRWNTGADVLASTAWQLAAGALFLLPVAAAAEGLPPALSAPELLAFGYVAPVATALAFAAWFTGLRHLPAGTVGLVGLLNPVTGVLLGTAVAGEALNVQQLCGPAFVLAGVVLGRPARAGRRGSRRTALHPVRDQRPPASPPPATPGEDGPRPPRSGRHRQPGRTATGGSVVARRQSFTGRVRARTYSDAVLYDAAFAAVLVFVTTSRVISPQYLIWLLGLGALCLTGRSTVQRRPVLLILAACFFTVLEFPVGFGQVVRSDLPGIVVLLIRDGLLLAATVSACRRLWRSTASGPEATPDDAAFPDPDHAVAPLG
ncbi:DMT family transporter [Streptomyces monashensis]|uniref:DMT family transporter n=1 Tax=Streptomyces monashensis TaxID=1678012 RepID=UPI003CCBAB5A